jgi:hypothetical protein
MHSNDDKSRGACTHEGLGHDFNGEVLLDLVIIHLVLLLEQQTVIISACVRLS